MNAPQTLNVTECHQLLDALLCKKGTKRQFQKGVRNYCMALLMLDAGLRVGEVCWLRIDNLWFANSPVENIVLDADLAGKECTRSVPVSSRLKSAITEMHQSWWSLGAMSVLNFALYDTNRDFCLSTRQVERIIRAAAMKCLGRPVHPHMLRHTFASRLMRKTNMRVVQELLGHKNLSSTQVYTHPNGDDMRQAIDSIEA